MVTTWGLPIVPIVWESIVLDEPPTPARTGLLLFIPVYPHISTYAYEGTANVHLHFMDGLSAPR